MLIRKRITLLPLENIILITPDVVGLHRSNPHLVDKLNYSEIVTNMWNLLTAKTRGGNWFCA